MQCQAGLQGAPSLYVSQHGMGWVQESTDRGLQVGNGSSLSFWEPREFQERLHFPEEAICPQTPTDISCCALMGEAVFRSPELSSYDASYILSSFWQEFGPTRLPCSTPLFPHLYQG